MHVSPGQVQLDDLLTVCRAGDRLNRALLTEMLSLFIDENHRRIGVAMQAADHGDPVALRSAVHAIKGSAALVGASQLRDLAADIEMRVLGGVVHDFSAATGTLRDEFLAVVDTLRSLYPDLPAA